MTATKDAPPAGRRSFWLLDLYRSQIGRKWSMAITGVILLGFIIFHLVGNLKVYLGPEDINEYGEALRDLGGHIAPRTHLLWIMRFGLIAAFGIHIHAAFSLAFENRRKGGDVGYQTQREYLVASYASRTMIWSGIIVLLFIAYHLADLTWGWTNPDFIRGDIYHNMVESFSRAPVAAIYIVANVALGFHIYHGAWSLFQSIGVNNPRFNQWRKWFAQAFAVTIVVGNVLFPIMVLAGVIE